jgi:hypothetical protein
MGIKDKALFAMYLAARRHQANLRQNRQQNSDNYDDHVDSDCYDEDDDHDL